MEHLIDRLRAAQLEETLVDEKKALNLHCWKRIKNLLAAKGKEVDVYSTPDKMPFAFGDSVKYGNEAYKFLLAADDVDLAKADGISLAIPVLGETLVFFENGMCDFRKDDKNKGFTHADEATFQQVYIFSGMLNLIDSQFLLPGSQNPQTS